MLKNRKYALITYKIFFALLGLSALVTEIATLAERGRFNPINFFSFFTVESNVLVVVVLLLSAVAISLGKNERLDHIRAATTVFILIVGVGFSFLLKGLDPGVLTAVPWTNTVLHYVIPAAVLVDYIIDRPQRKLGFVRSSLWLLFPILYGVYCFVRGSLTGWYPYPFLNPAINSYASIIITILGLAILGLGLVFVITKLSGIKPKGRNRTRNS